MTAIVDGVVICGQPDEICLFLLKHTKSVDELQEELGNVIAQQKQLTEKEQKYISNIINRWRNEK